jgi:hypothetical protein
LSAKRKRSSAGRSAHPVWAIAAIIVDGLIIWALTTHLDEFV